MTFDPTLLMLSLIPSGIGFVLFVYGRKLNRWPQLVTGLVLLVYPYFTETVLSMTVVGAACAVALWLMLRAGW